MSKPARMTVLDTLTDPIDKYCKFCFKISLWKKKKETHPSDDLGQEIGQPGQFGAAYLVRHKETKEMKAAKVSLFSCAIKLKRNYKL